MVGLASKVHAAVADVSSVAAAHIQATDPENSNAAVPLLPVPYPNQQFNGEAFETSDVVARGSKSKASGSKVKAPRQIKPIRDPNAPRKPVTSFFLYSANERKKIRSQREDDGQPPLTNNEMTLELARRWNILEKPERDYWGQLYSTHLEKYKVDKKLYEEKQALEKAKPEAAAESHSDEGSSGSPDVVDDVVPIETSSTDVTGQKSNRASKRKSSKSEKEAPVAESPSKASSKAADSTEASTTAGVSEPSKKRHKRADRKKKEKS